MAMVDDMTIGNGTERGEDLVGLATASTSPIRTDRVGTEGTFLQAEQVHWIGPPGGGTGLACLPCGRWYMHLLR